MTASPSQPPDPAEWFLQAPGGKSTIRITTGLVLGEDERGHFDIGPDATFPLVRFEVEGGAPCIHVVSRDWVLAAPERMVGDSHRVRRTTLLSLPNNEFRIVGGGPADEEPERIELTRRYALTWLRPSSGASERDTSQGAADPFTAAAETDDDITEPLLADAPRAPGARDAPAAPGPSGPTPGRAALFSNMPEPDRRPEPHPQSIPHARPAAPAGVFAVPQRPRHSRSRHRSRRPSSSEPRWSVTLLTIALYLGTLMFSAPVQTPVPERTSSEAGAAAQADDGLLASVEQLLREQSPPDRSTLDFAVKAYRAAHSRRPDDDRLRRRLAELESVGATAD